MESDLRLPLIQAHEAPKPSQRRPLEIEDLLNFMEFNLRHTIDLKAVREIKRKFSVSLPFRLD